MRKVLKIGTAVVLGAVFYLMGLSVFLATQPAANEVIDFLRWAFLPVIAAVGFALGIWVFERKPGSRFSRILVWTLVGCVVPSMIVVPFGAMLIVFALCSGGTLSVILREVLLNRDRIK